MVQSTSGSVYQPTYRPMKEPTDEGSSAYQR